jgi:DNA-directed RNA polymerase specialized sigma24 family protein
MMDQMLVEEVVPRLRNAARTIPKIGHEDDEEIIQDATLMAARMMDSAERAGHPVTAGNVSYYAAKAARSGRRSYSAGRSDVLSPGCKIDGRARHEWLDDEIEIEMEFGDICTLHDVIAPPGYGCGCGCGYQGAEPDPAEEAARNLDWESFLASHPPRHRIAILVLVEGGTMREAGRRCGLKDSAALNLKRRIAADLIDFFGEDVIRRLLDGVRPGWESDLRAVRDRHVGRVGNAAESSCVWTRG